MTQLATRCVSCGTSFRISEEQLAISDGFVRCGRCDTVFNARAALFDLSTGQPAAPDPAAEEQAPQPLPIAAEPQWDAQQAELAPVARDDDPRQEPQWQATEAPEVEASAAAPEEANERLREMLGVALAAPEAASSPTSPVSSTAAAPAAVWSSLARSKPAPRASSRWGVAVGGLMAALLTLGLPLQWAWIEREVLRARSPQLDALLSQHLPGLPSQGLRQLDGLSVASSSLLATPQGSAYQLDLVLHNRGSQALAMPWLDLKLSDGQARLLVRKSVAPAELSAPRPLQPGEQRRLQAVFRIQAAEAAVSGYEIGLFHP